MHVYVGGDAEQSVQAQSVPERHEVLAEKDSHEEDGETDPLDQMVHPDHAERHVINGSGVVPGGLARAQDEAVHVGVDVGHSHYQDELANVANQTPGGKDSLTFLNDCREVLRAAVKAEVVLFFRLLFLVFVCDFRHIV